MANLEKMHGYDRRDVQMLFQQTNAGDWNAAIAWLRSEGYRQLAPGHAESMLLDLERLQHDHEPFVRDPLQVYGLAMQKHQA